MHNGGGPIDSEHRTQSRNSKSKYASLRTIGPEAGSAFQVASGRRAERAGMKARAGLTKIGDLAGIIGRRTGAYDLRLKEDATDCRALSSPTGVRVRDRPHGQLRPGKAHERHVIPGPGSRVPDSLALFQFQLVD